MSKIEQVLGIMMHLGMIPKDGGFEITQEHVDQFGEVYRELVPKTSKIKVSNARANDRLSGLNLLKLNLSRGFYPKAGLVYLISNPAFEGYYKVGMTQDVYKRLASYQTYDPLRRYKIEHYKFVLDKRAEEKRILELYKKDLAKGEWVNSLEVKQIFYEI